MVTLAADGRSRHTSTLDRPFVSELVNSTALSCRVHFQVFVSPSGRGIQQGAFAGTKKEGPVNSTRNRSRSSQAVSAQGNYLALEARARTALTGDAAALADLTSLLSDMRTGLRNLAAHASVFRLYTTIGNALSVNIQGQAVTLAGGLGADTSPHRKRDGFKRPGSANESGAMGRCKQSKGCLQHSAQQPYSYSSPTMKGIFSNVQRWKPQLKHEVSTLNYPEAGVDRASVCRIARDNIKVGKLLIL